MVKKRPNPKYLEPMLEKAFSNFLNKYRATCFLVDREYQLFHTFNDGIDVFKIPLGKTTTDITKLVVPDLQLPLVTALHRAQAERSPISYRGIKVQENSSRYLDLEVVYHDDRLTDDFYCITIQEESALQLSQRFNADVEANQRIFKLEHELQQTRENLQGVIEEHYCTNKESIASNEKLHSVNIARQKHTEAELRESAAREISILKIVSKIRQTFDLDEIFQTTTNELRSTLKCDRLVLYRFNSDWSGKFVTESVGEGWISLIKNELHILWRDTYLQTTQGGRYKEHQTFVIDDVARANFDDCHRELYDRIQAKAFCIAPVFQGDRLWGLLAAYQNHNPRHWKEGEISLLTQTGIQLGISLAQVDLFTQLQNQTKQLQQAKETAEAANHAKSVFIAHTSHELRTPLNAILGFARILQNQPDNNPAQSRAIEAIGQSGQHLLTLINDILHLAKIEAGKLTLELRDFILPSFLNNLTDIIRIRCQQKEIKFEYKVLSTLPTIVKGDETRLRQLLFNLLSNAIKFTDRGKVEFTVGYVNDFSRDLTSEPNKIRFCIKDTGCGIPKTEYQDIFLPFHQLDLHRSFQEGTGLGLTISRNLAEQMGSQIQIESTIGRGSVFWFDLDFSVVETVREITAFENVDLGITGYTGSIKRILIVDNSQSDRQLAELLTPLGFKVIEAESESKAMQRGLGGFPHERLHQEAIALTHQERPDLVFLSSSILDIDNSELIRHLRQAGLDNLPVIILAAGNIAASESKGDRSVADGFLAKPIYFEQLLRTIEQHLNITWITADGTKQLLPSHGLSISLSDTEDTCLAIVTIEQLTKLLELSNQGDIRGTISYATTLEQRSQLKPFTQKIIQLAENCQLRKLKQLIQQHIAVKESLNSHAART